MLQKVGLTPKSCSIVIILVSCFIFLNSLNGDFVWDDTEQITENSLIKDIKNIPAFFTSDHWRLLDYPTLASYYYRPLFLVSLTIDYHLWGLNPVGYHVTNLILHVLVSFLVYQVGRKIFPNNISAFLGALIFAIHPAHVESVAWISGRSDLLATVFFLLSFYFYILYTEDKKTIILISSLLFYFCSLLSKEMGITLPILLFAYAVIMQPSMIKESSKKEFFISIGFYILVTVVYLILRAISIGAVIEGSTSSLPFHKRMYSSFTTLLHYLQIMVAPVNWKVLYETPLMASLMQPFVLFSAITIVILLVFSLWSYRIDRSICFASLWYFITIIPVSNLFVTMKPTLLALRLIYLPSIGICFLGGLALNNLTKQTRVFYLKPLVVALLILFSFITWRGESFYRDNITFFKKMVDDAPENTIAHHNLGDAYREKGDIESAITEWKKSLAIDPRFSESNNSLGNIFLMQKNYPEAIKKYNMAIKGSPEKAEPYYNAAIALEKMGYDDKAISYFKAFLERTPSRYEEISRTVKRRIKTLEERKNAIP